MVIRATIGAGAWDILVCEECSHMWCDLDLDLNHYGPEYTVETECPNCHSRSVVREERY